MATRRTPLFLRPWQALLASFWILAVTLLLVIWVRSDSLSDAYKVSRSKVEASFFTHQGSARLILDDGHFLVIDEHDVDDGWNVGIEVPEEENVSSIIGKMSFRVRTVGSGKWPNDLFISIPFWLVFLCLIGAGLWLLRSIRRYRKWLAELHLKE